jgi:hypothetical protein
MRLTWRGFLGVSFHMRVLRVMRFFVHPDRIASVHNSTKGMRERERLARSYFAVTGQTLEERAQQRLKVD